VGESRVQILARHYAGEDARATFKSKKEKAAEISLNSLYLSRRRPTLPHTFACSTIGPAGLNFRVRDGNGWIPRGKITDKRGSGRQFWRLAKTSLQTWWSHFASALQKQIPRFARNDKLWIERLASNQTV
jgi:hypothetical protein